MVAIRMPRPNRTRVDSWLNES